MRLMRRLKWRRGTTDKNIAAHWGITHEAVRHYSGEASRRLRAEMTDPDSTAATVCIALERVIREAAQKGMYGHRSLIEAAKTWAQIAGAGAPTRLEIGALASMTEEQLNRRRTELLAALAKDDKVADAPPTDEELAAAYAAKAEGNRKFLAEYNGPKTIGGSGDPDVRAARAGCEAEEAENRTAIALRFTPVTEPEPEDPTIPAWVTPPRR
jgi:hypothetical protein